MLHPIQGSTNEKKEERGQVERGEGQMERGEGQVERGEGQCFMKPHQWDIQSSNLMMVLTATSIAIVINK